MLNDAVPGITFKKVYILTGRTDMRKGITGLASLVQMKFGMDPLETGTLFLFCGRNRRKLKGLVFEGDGYLLLSKQLSDGRFIWPNSESEAKRLTKEQYRSLMSGFAIEPAIRKRVPKHIG